MIWNYLQSLPAILSYVSSRKNWRGLVHRLYNGTPSRELVGGE